MIPMNGIYEVKFWNYCQDMTAHYEAGCCLLCESTSDLSDTDYDSEDDHDFIESDSDSD